MRHQNATSLGGRVKRSEPFGRCLDPSPGLRGNPAPTSRGGRGPGLVLTNTA